MHVDFLQHMDTWKWKNEVEEWWMKNDSSDDNQSTPLTADVLPGL